MYVLEVTISPSSCLKTAPVAEQTPENCPVDINAAVPAELTVWCQPWTQAKCTLVGLETTLTPRTSERESAESSGSGSSEHVAIIVPIVVCGTVLLVVGAVFMYARRARRQAATANPLAAATGGLITTLEFTNPTYEFTIVPNETAPVPVPASADTQTDV